MLNERIATFTLMVETLIRELRTKASSTIAGELISRLFPETKRASVQEDAYEYLHEGVKQSVMKITKKEPPPAGQIDFANVYPHLFPYIAALKRSSYYSPLQGEYLYIHELIEAPTLLDDCRQYLRKHGEDTLDEASRLDDLYQAIKRAGE